MIKLLNIYKIFNEGKANEKTVLNNVNLTIGKGELVAVIGKSGAGKSTLLNIIDCMDTMSKGSYLLDEICINKLNSNKLAEIRSKKIGFITQNPFLIEELSAIDNVTIPLMLNKSKHNKRIAKATESIVDVGLSEIINQKVSTMSGGEKQRVSIARAIVNEPEVILADEPTGSLDSVNAENILKILLNINKTGKTVIIVTHDIDIAKRCSRIITIADGKIKI